MLKSSSICDEKELILQVSAGSEHSFAELFNRYKNKLYSFIVSLSGSNQLAEDVVQDVFLKVWQKREDLGNIDNFSCYLFRMAHNHALNIIKRMAKETLIISKITRQSEAAAAEPFFELEYKDTRSHYIKSVEKLPPQQRLVFTMSREKGLKQQEIARMLNITVPTVKSHMTQALRFLRKESNTSYPLIIPFLLAALAGFFD